MAQQTATEWLIQNIQKVHKMDWDIVFIQAKEIEKQQIIDAFDTGTTDDNLIGKEYYNETYNK